MDIEQNKAIVREYCEALSNGDLARVMALTSDDYHCWVPGPKDKIPVCGHADRAVTQQRYDAWPIMFPNGFKVTIKGMTAEGDRVAVEAESYGETSKGKIYNQTYHYLFIVRDGKIAVQHEYLDTLHLKERMVDDYKDILPSS